MENKRPLRIVVVAMSESIHTVRWLEQIADQGWEIHLFPSNDNGLLHPESPKIIVHHSIYGRRPSFKKGNLAIKGLRVYSNFLAGVSRGILEKIIPDYRTRQLRKLIKKIKPDIIHSMEFQAAGYLTLETKKHFQGKFPTWIATIWGSDIYLYGRLVEHKNKIRQILQNCDYFSCECYRDVYLAKNFGLKGQVLAVGPVSAGYDMQKISRWRKKLTSQRKLIMLKGYQSVFGRSLVGLRALERCAKWLKGYKIVIYLVEPGSPVFVAAELMANATGIPIQILPRVSHEEILKLHGQARISIGLSISDGISVSFLEALAMGSFPIQSWTSCADEWITDGKTGILVPPEDPDRIARAIKKVLVDDSLVCVAARKNWQTVKKKLDKKNIKRKTVDFYQKVLEDRFVNI